MGLTIYTLDRNSNTPLEYLAAGAIALKVGMALVVENGLLAVASGAKKPQYISMANFDTVASGTQVPVIRVNSDTIFETENQADFASIKVGDKVTLHTDGMQVTATKTSGVAEVVAIGGTAVGSKIRVRF